MYYVDNSYLLALFEFFMSYHTFYVMSAINISMILKLKLKFSLIPQRVWIYNFFLF